jgi:hypothetical protein
MIRHSYLPRSWRTLACGLAVAAVICIPASANEAIGVIVKLDAQKGIVVVEDLAGKAYGLTVGTGQPFNELRIGQRVIFDLSSKSLALAKNRFAISKAAKLDKRTLKITSVDPQGNVRAHSTATGQIVNFSVSSETLETQKLRAGKTIDAAFIGRFNINRVCPCGQKSDGSCWCVADVEACCGPQHGCPMGSCDKKQDLPQDKPVYETTTPPKP